MSRRGPGGSLFYSWFVDIDVKLMLARLSVCVWT